MTLIDWVLMAAFWILAACEVVIVFVVVGVQRRYERLTERLDHASSLWSARHVKLIGEMELLEQKIRDNAHYASRVDGRVSDVDKRLAHTIVGLHEGRNIRARDISENQD